MELWDGRIRKASIYPYWLPVGTAQTGADPVGGKSPSER